MTPTLSILVASIESRKPLAERLAMCLIPQIVAAHGAADLQWLVDRGQLPTGTKRQQLLNGARGKYCAFIDDDDLVAPDYVAAILKAAEANTDQITFNLRRSTPSAVEEWRFSAFDTTPANQGHQRDPSGALVYYANHLCPTKRELLGAVPWLPISFREDISHYEPMWAAGLVRTSIHVDRILYLYLFRNDPAGSHRTETRQATLKLLRNGLRVFRHVPTGRLCIEATRGQSGGCIDTYTPGGGRERLAAGDLTVIHTLRRCK